MAELGETEEDRRESEALLRLLNSKTPLITPTTNKRLPKLPRRSRPARSSSPNEYLSPSAVRRRASQAHSKLSAKTNLTPSSRDVSYLGESRQHKGNTKTTAQLLTALGYSPSAEEIRQDLPASLTHLDASGTLPDLSYLLEGVNTNDFTAPIGKLHRHRDSAVAPPSRKDVEALAQWVDRMQAEALAKHAQSPSQLFQQTQLIYSTCFTQLVAQVTAQCSERGQLLEKVWKAYIGLFEKAIETYKAEKEGDDEKYLRTVARLNQKYGEQLANTRKQSQEHESRAADYSLRIQVLQDTLDKECAKEDRLTKRNQLLETALEGAEQRIEVLEREVISLRKMMSGTLDDFRAGVPGSKAILQAMAKVIAPKSGAMKMAEEVFKHELTDIIQSEDISPFKDIEIQTEFEQITVETQTDIGDFQVPVVDVDNEPIKEVLLPISDEKFSGIDMNEEDIWRKSLTDANSLLENLSKAADIGLKLGAKRLMPISQRLNAEIWTLSRKQEEKLEIWTKDRSELVREIDRLRDLLSKKARETDEIRAELQSLQQSIASEKKPNPIRSNESPRASLKDSQRASTRRSPTKPSEFQLNKRNLLPKSDLHPASGLLEAAINSQSTPTGFTAKTLLRHLQIIWNDYLAQLKASDSARNQQFLAYVYDWHLMKYGLKKVAEAKLQQVLLSLRRFLTASPRLDWFGRLCGIQERLSVEEVRFYVGLQEFLTKL
jgi:hypothetical protein